ncbi:MAG: L-glutamate gamma-semialdehyde dehydrogenase [Saprospiraceae bacterium]|nr:L-glutamate gamma-semialdehyde dehydrogenase [Saprospiraceae bacterium]MBK8369859.1 L-glutamate gamma-semialdehyde dehydrogenase [Saprospiraceae bacterium]MBK8855772.1 L-glutamate gamma-semialdehyde dehydrogenase [Saprospiraceae bacterium]MBP6695442.1 L-glutamate gamma-semialdehyde dehydrogenase [Saprospiraceae bacterium]
MSNAFFNVPVAKNEPVLSYAPKSKEKIELKKVLAEMKSQYLDIPMYIGGNKIYSDHKKEIFPPHDVKNPLGQYSQGNSGHVQMAIDAALSAKKDWENMSWQDRAAIFLKAADLLAGPFRAKMNAATMLGQSKNVYQSEIDAVCELADFFRFNVRYMTEIYQQQPESMPGLWNRLEYRPLEGYVFALTPFNFTSIAANLCSAPALMGNTVVWKPSETQIYSAAVIMEIYEAAGLPPGVINLVYVDGPQAGEVIFNHKEFAGLHFTGSTGVFQKLWQKIGQNISMYKSYPRIVGETGGKDFVVAHPSALAKEVAVALSRGAFEFQGQKCSAASRAYIPASLWPEVERFLKADLSDFKMGSPENFTNFINAVIDEKSFDKLSGFIDNAKNDSNVRIVAGGHYDKTVGYFIEPTVILTKDPHYVTMCEELFGPVLTIYVYDDEKWAETLDLVDKSSPYALTGAVFSQNRYALAEAFEKLRHSAGNYYVNDKPTGAVVGQQPFGGGRASGTNDKAGSHLNLLRWVSPRTIKENFVPPADYTYPFLAEE